MEMEQGTRSAYRANLFLMYSSMKLGLEDALSEAGWLSTYFSVFGVVLSVR